MEKKLMFFGLCFVVVGLCSSVALSSPIGPPVASLGTGQYSIGIDYSNTDMDINLDGDMRAVQVSDPNVTEEDEFDTVLNFKSNMIFGNLGYGITDEVDVFARIGMADGELEDTIDDSFKFAWGFGAKATLYEEEALQMGAIFQMNFGSAKEDDVEIYYDEDVELCGDMELDYYEMKIAVGPVYTLENGISVYGGPFYQLFRGDFDFPSTTTVLAEDYDVDMSADIEEESQFGGYVGICLDVAENMPCYVEYQMTGDANILGINLTYEF